ncbi:MAG: 23S rRNA (uracil(1939)-C(5))-methyltransferase RlmD [Candidatus Ornithomonoglobus sp.]
MIDTNKRYNIEIKDISSDGNGVGTVDGFAVFVPMTAAGDVIEAEITRVKTRYAEGKMIRLLTPSPDRTEPQCPVYAQCGGCNLQHINYDAQIRAKKELIEAAFRRIGGFDGFECDEMLRMGDPFRYRNKCIFQIGKNSSGELVSGFYANKTHEIIPVRDCLLCGDINSKISAALLEYMRENNVSAYDEKTHKGIVRRLFIRSARANGEIMVVVSVNADGIQKRERLIKRLREVSESIVSVYVNINKDKNSHLMGRENKLIYGKSEINDTLCGTAFGISPDSFYQVNPRMTQRLYNKALEYAAISENDNVMDVYCGIGTISLAAAQRAKRVTGIEIVQGAVADAKKNAERNGITNAEFYADSAENAVPKLIASGLRPDIVILDPPRKGSDEATLKAIADAAPERIVYISCNPATLARDAKYLAARGYNPVKCAGADMFGNTCHVETVVLYEDKKIAETK